MPCHFLKICSSAAERIFLFACLFTFVLVLPGCESKSTETVEKSSDAPSPPAEVAVEEPDDDSPYPLPTGGADELYTFLHEVVAQEPRGETDQEKTDDLANQMESRIRAAERLESIAESEEQLIAAKHAKLESLRVLGMIGRDKRRSEFVSYAAALSGDDVPKIAQLGRLAKFQSQLDEFFTREQGDAESIVMALKALLDKEPADRRTFEVANEAARGFQNVGLANEASIVFGAIGEKFADSSEPEIAKSAQNALAQSRLAQVVSTFQQAMSGQPGAQESFLNAAEQALAGESVPPAVLMPMLSITQNLEFSGNVEIASKIYQRLQELAGEINDEKVRQQIQQVVDGGLKRVGLIGEPFEIVGQKVSGEEFSWDTYEDKVVLVDFWATWCGPCIAEVPNLRKNYDQYHEQGFEIVSLNLDQQQELVAPYLEKNPLPWETVISADPDAVGFSDPNAVKYNVQAIPFLVLVGRDGKVDALHLRGELLNSRLAELFSDGASDESSESSEGSTNEERDAESMAAEDFGEVEMNVPEAEDDGPTSDDSDGVEIEDTETLPPDDPPQSVLEMEGNPYLADAALSGSELMLYLLELADKPTSIQRRPGFRDAIVDAADRVLKESANQKHKRLAAQNKIKFLHRDACLGDEQADAELMSFVEQLQKQMPEELADELHFLSLERRALDPQAAEVDLVKGCCEFLESQGEMLGERHLRLASATVEIINRLPAADREPHFQRVAKALLTSKARDVSRYGKRLAGKPTNESIVGRQLELAGVTTDGNVFDIKHYRQEIVVVDFWATWCGPCRKAQPVLAKLGDAYEGLRFVGVNLDADEEALATFLKTARFPGVVVYGQEAQRAAENYSIRALPTFLVLDADGTIQATTNRVDKLEEIVKPLLETKLAEN